MKRARTFPGQGESVTAARRFVRDVLRDQSDEILEVVELMTSELATNCVRHARTGFELGIEVARGQVRVEARDSGQGRPTLRFPTPSEPSGRGLRIVEALSERWGVIPSGSGKTVWFTVSSTGSPQPEASASEEVGPSAPSRGRRTEATDIEATDTDIEATDTDIEATDIVSSAHARRSPRAANTGLPA